MPRLFLIEAGYDLAIQAAEADWVRALLEELAAGSFPGLHAWRAWVAQRRALLDEPAMVAALGEPAGGGRFEDSGGPKDRGG